MINSFIRKWLGVPRCLSGAALYGKGILELPLSSLAEEFKFAKARLELNQRGNGGHNRLFSKDRYL